MSATIIAMAGLAAAVVAAWLALPTFRSERMAKRDSDFRSERLDLTSNRVRHIGESVDLYAAADFIDGSRCLSPPSWRLPTPVLIERVNVVFESREIGKSVSGSSTNAKRVLPRGLRRSSARYVDAISGDSILRPTLWWDAPSYDLLEFRADGESLTIRCTVAQYFEMVDLCESIAHEFASARGGRRTGTRGRRTTLPLRDEVGDPFDITRRVFVPAVPTLLLFVAPDGSVKFPLHARDEAAVISQGGFRHVIGGQFQPSSEHALDPADDANLWLTVCRELAEEVLGYEDADGHAGGRLAFDEPPLSHLKALRLAGHFKVWVLGMGLDPLSLWPDILTVAVINEAEFSTCFPDRALKNSEGALLGARMREGRVEGFDFAESVIDQICADPRTAPGATGCLRLAWQHRDQLLSDSRVAASDRPKPNST